MAKIKILIAEDIQLLREDLVYIVTHTPDMKVVGAAESGAEIIELAGTIPFDIILMDIEMEHVKAGITATRVIKEHNPEAKVIFLTAHDNQETILSAMGTGAIDYIVKGVADEELVKHIRLAMSGQPLLDHKIQELVMGEYKRLRQSEKSLLFFITNIATLTKAERELVKLLLEGLTVKKIAETRVVEIVTVKSQISRLLKKFDLPRTRDVVKLVRDLKIEHLFYEGE